MKIYKCLLIVALALFTIGCSGAVENDGATGEGPQTGGNAAVAPNLEGVEK